MPGTSIEEPRLYQYITALLCAVRRRGGIETLAQFLAGAEEGHTLFFDRDGGTCARIAPLTSGPHFDREGSETTQLDAVTGRQRAGDFVKHSRDDALDIAVVQMRVALRKARHQFRFDHSHCPPYGKRARNHRASNDKVPKASRAVNWIMA